MAEALVQITRYSKADYYEMIGEIERRRDDAILEPQLPLKRLSKYVAKSVTEGSRRPPPECTTCGVCCSFALIVPVRTDEAGGLPEHWGITSDGVVIERVLGRDLQTGCCEHLEGTLGERIGCRIYERRPDVCREFEPGSDRCLEYRRMYRIDRQLSEAEVDAAVAALGSTIAGVVTHASLDAVSIRTSLEAATEGQGFETRRHVRMRATVAVDHKYDEPIELFEYDAEADEWHETELLGMTIAEATAAANERRSKIL